MYSVLRILLILTVSAVAGIAQKFIGGHAWTPDLAEVKKDADLSDKTATEHEALLARAAVTFEQFMERVQNGAVVIDARPAEEFAKEHLAPTTHMPVLNIDPDKFDAELPRIEKLRGQPLVIYCTSTTCDLGEKLFHLLEPLGFDDMKIYPPGWDGLKQRGVAIATGPDSWTGFESPPADPAMAEPSESDPSEQPK